MIKYKELDLKKIRETANLDFAHYTFKKHMCSCCYGPKDLPKKYWKDGIVPTNDNYSFILFKNAKNGSGAVTKEDYIKNLTHIRWRMSKEQLDMVCDMLLEQLGDGYIIGKPRTKEYCIFISTKDFYYENDELNDESKYIFLSKEDGE